MSAARDRQDRLVKPPGALGRLEDLSVWLAGVQGRCPPAPFERVRAVVLAGDHGVAARGVSAYPGEVTAQMVATMLAGGAAVNVLAELCGATVRVVDVTVATGLRDAPDDVSRHKVRTGTGSIDREPAMTEAETLAAVGAGMAVADEEVDAGADLLVTADMGIGNTTVAATVAAAVLGLEPVEVVGRGSGAHDHCWAAKVVATRDALRRSGFGGLEAPGLAVQPSWDVVRLLAEVGGGELAAMVGLLVQAAVRRTPVVLDGVVSGVAALLATQVAPGVSDYLVAGHRCPEPTHRHCLEWLGLDPLLDLGIRLGEGTGALLAVPLLQTAVATLAEMATFASAGVSERVEPPPQPSPPAVQPAPVPFQLAQPEPAAQTRGGHYDAG